MSAKSVIREPLLHFLANGAALFLYFHRSAGGSGPTSRRVVLTAGQINQPPRSPCAGRRFPTPGTKAHRSAWQETVTAAAAGNVACRTSGEALRKIVPGLPGLMLVTTFAPAVASAAEDWKFAITPCLWGAGHGARIPAGQVGHPGRGGLGSR